MFRSGPHVILMGFKILHGGGVGCGQVSFLHSSDSPAALKSAHRCCLIRTAWYCRWAVRSAGLMEGAHVHREHKGSRSLMQYSSNTKKVGLQLIKWDARQHPVHDLPSPPCRRCSSSAIQPRMPHASGERPASVHLRTVHCSRLTSCICSLQRTPLQKRFLCRAMAAPTSAFDIPAAPILIPKGPWKEVDGCVCAPKGFKAQGKQSTTIFRVFVPTHYKLL